MTDSDRMRTEGERFTKSVGELLGVELTPEIAMRLFIACMGPARSELYRVSLMYGCEADKCKSVGAYFSCCLMYASAIEALLAVLCLTAQAEVEGTRPYKDFKRGAAFEEKVLSADFHNYIEVACCLGWVPSDVVAADVLSAAIQDFPLIAANLFPNCSGEERESMFKAFQTQPGIEMLRVLKHLRNLIHAARWPRLGISTNSAEFEADCKFVVVIASQVLICLGNTFTRLAENGMASAHAISANMSDEVRTMFRHQILAMAKIDKGS